MDSIESKGKPTTHLVIRRKRSKSPLWTRVSSLTLALVLLTGVVIGAPLHSSERSCSISTAEMSDCEMMAMKHSPAATGTAYCCFTDCQEPGPTGPAFTLRIPTFSNSIVRPDSPQQTAAVLQQLPQEKRLRSSSFSPPNTYLKNLALLI